MRQCPFLDRTGVNVNAPELLRGLGLNAIILLLMTLDAFFCSVGRGTWCQNRSGRI